MKKSTAVCLIAGFTFIILGIITVLASISMGVIGQVKDMAIIGNDKDFKVYNETYDSVNSIDFDINAANLEITDGDEFSIKYSKQDKADFETYVDENGVWHINGSIFDKRIILANIISMAVNNNKQTIYITIPADAELSDISVKLDAGNIEWDSIKGNSCNIDLNAGNIELSRADIKSDFELDCSAGNVELESCTAQKLNMSVDAGNIDVGYCIASEVYMSVDAGNIEWRGDIEENINVDSNMGNVTIRMPGNTDDYNIYADSDLGSITLNDKEYSGLDKTISINNNASKKINVESDLGNIEIYIKD